MDPLYKPGIPLGWAKERIEEKLDRGLIAIKGDKGVYLGWRLLKSDPADVAFNVYRAIDEAQREAAAHDDGFRGHERGGGSAADGNQQLDGRGGRERTRAAAVRSGAALGGHAERSN